MALVINPENSVIVWTESHEGGVVAEAKNTKRAAVMAYNKIGRSGVSYKTYGWSIAEDAEPKVRKAAGLPAFPPSKF